MNASDNITSLKLGEVFVFGSNTSGHHAGGAAKIAHEKFGAVWGEAVGGQGASYAIPTLGENVTLETIQTNVKDFLEYARKHKNLTFLVTKIGCGIAGWPEEDMKKMFRHVPGNVWLPKDWQ